MTPTASPAAQPAGIAMLPPGIGPAPKAPAGIGRALALLDGPIDVRRAEVARRWEARAGDPTLRAVGEIRRMLAQYAVLEEGLSRHWGDGIRGSFRRGMEACIDPALLNYERLRANGLSGSELQMWACGFDGALPAGAGAELLGYAAACRAWECRLRSAIGGPAEPDWDMTSAGRARPNAAEARLARQLEEHSVPVQAQVGVSQLGGPREGGWYTSYWLDCAHRDVAFLLRIDVELDGACHRQGERPWRDALRNALLAERGWYIVRLDYAAGRRDGFARGARAVAALARRHRRAIVLGRTDEAALNQHLQHEGDA